MKKTLGILLVFVGIVFISYPFFLEWKQNKEVQALEEALMLIENTRGKEADLSEIEHLSISEQSLKNIFELEIPYINLRQKILDESTPENLKIALTQIKQEQTPGQGNFTIAGHRGYRDGRHFSNLSEVPIGELIYLHDKDYTYVYEIVSAEVIEATDVHVLDDEEGKDEITLITCTVSGKQRLAVKGNLVNPIEK